MMFPLPIEFLWPRLLWAMCALPLLVLAYGMLRRRATRQSQRFSGLRTVGELAGFSRRGAALRRAAPPVLWLLAITLLTLALARPQAALRLPSRLDTVVLAVDMSGSMRATDLTPDRITAARVAARSFVEAQPSHVKVGVVAIAAAAAVTQTPTDNRADILQALDRLEPQRGTALGSGLIIALDSALPRAGIQVDRFINASSSDASGNAASGAKESNHGNESTAGQSADAASAAIVLLSDGQSNVGPDPVKAAEVAAKYGVRIYTVGIGTAEGTVVKSEGWSMRVRLDEEALKKIAAVTSGEYFRAADAGELKRIYRSLASRLSLEPRRPVEITALVSAVAALLAMCGAFLSMRWYGRIL